jgi:dihydroflavonol-4-reductase
MTVVVTGAAGHIGGNLVRMLLADGRKVRAMLREDERAVAGLDVERVRGDLFEPETLRRAFDGADVVYHLAARITIVGALGGLVERTNVEGPRNVARACRDAGVRRLVHFSSIHAFVQPPVGEPLDETRPLADDDR